MKRAPPIADPAVRAVFDSYPARLRAPLMKLRGLIFEAAAEAVAIGPLVETLKWNEPAYLPARPRTGSAVRLKALGADRYQALFHCQTTLIATFRSLYPNAFTFDGARGLVFAIGDAVPEAAFKHCAALSLSYHLKPSRRAG